MSNKLDNSEDSQTLSPKNNSAIFVVGQSQNIGKRSQQQDAYGFSFGSNIKGSLFMVADGMGGMEFGDIASHFTVDFIKDDFDKKSEMQDIPNYFIEILKEANNRVFDFASEKDLAGGVGTTFVGIVIQKDKLYWASIGDSRIYLYKNSYLTQLSFDHVYLNELNKKVQQGEITIKQALSHREKGFLTSYLGVENLQEIDYNIKPYILEKGDKIVLCSDGIYGVLSEAEFCEHLSKDPQTCSNDIVKAILAKKIDSQDNLTIITIEYRGE